MLRERGDDTKAGEAERELPDQVDTDRHAELLEGHDRLEEEVVRKADRAPVVRSQDGRGPLEGDDLAADVGDHDRLADLVGAGEIAARAPLPRDPPAAPTQRPSSR